MKKQRGWLHEHFVHLKQTLGSIGDGVPPTSRTNSHLLPYKQTRIERGARKRNTWNTKHMTPEAWRTPNRLEQWWSYTHKNDDN
jgi:hypothetical protein